MRRLNADKAGFTIVEVVVAMGILLLGMTSVLGLLSFGAALSRTAQLRNASAAAVEGIVADLEESLFPLVLDSRTGRTVVGAPTAIEDRPVPGHPDLVYSAVATGDPDDQHVEGPRRWRVEVTMSWSSSGRRHTKTFTTLMLREVPFGERLRRELMHEEPLRAGPNEALE